MCVEEGTCLLICTKWPQWLVAGPQHFPKPSFGPKGFTGLPDSIKQTVRTQCCCQWDVQEDTLETPLHGADQGPRGAAPCPSVRPLSLHLRPGRAEEGGHGERLAWGQGHNTAAALPFWFMHGGRGGEEALIVISIPFCFTLPAECSAQDTSVI